ncbi:MAG: CDP-alcohol phosphatidyltransferase family protein [Polaribacter sp.]
MKKYVPNLLTLANLFCGTLATIFAVQGNFVAAGFLVVLGIFFDFFDGFIARLLHVSGELGKQLDSLADMVTSGVVPGIIMFNLLSPNNFFGIHIEETNKIIFGSLKFAPIQLIGLILTLGACYRLAKFNIDTRQSESFIGLPTPAMSLFVISLPLIATNTENYWVQELIANPYFLVGTTFALCYLMNVEIPLFSLKFKEYSFKNNVIKYLFLLISLVMIGTLKYVSIPLIIILYVLLSILNNARKKTLV